MEKNDNNKAASRFTPRMSLPEASKDSILRRLRRLEGQARGVQRMVAEERDCREILHQIAAIKAAAHSLGATVLEHYVLTCLHDPPVSLTSEEALALVREAILQIAH